MIIDEEQHFGVKHKERLKEMRADVHVLTLSATPIPRTLQLALAGIREMSVIATPPIDRMAVRTYVTPFDDVTVREALLREKLSRRAKLLRRAAHRRSAGDGRISCASDVPEMNSPPRTAKWRLASSMRS